MKNFLEVLKTGALKLGVSVDETQLKRMELHWQLVCEYNKIVNLTAISDDLDAAEKHYLDSLLPLLLNLMPRLALDLGSGAGFPGIPLAICSENCNWVLLDSQEKRCKFLRDAVLELNLSNCSILSARAEEVGRDENREIYDLVTTRAVGKLDLIAEYALPLVKVGGHFLAFKGPSIGEEIILAKNAIARLGGVVESLKEYNLPFSGDKRKLIVIKKLTPTPDEYPRRPGVARKRPIGRGNKYQM